MLSFLNIQFKINLKKNFYTLIPQSPLNKYIMKMKKKLLALFSGIGILILVFGLYAFKANPTIEEGYIAQPPWKNLKVLPKDISKDSLDHLMKGYTLALGVKCNYCHAPSK